MPTAKSRRRVIRAVLRGEISLGRAVREGKVDELPDRLKEYGAERGLL